MCCQVGGNLVKPMKIKSREELQNLRAQAQETLEKRDKEKMQIFIGMASCGIAAGAREVKDAILEELQKQGLEAEVIEVGCVGICHEEPLVDIKRPGEERITYAKVKPQDVPRLIAEHVKEGRVVEDKAYARFEELN